MNQRQWTSLVKVCLSLMIICFATGQCDAADDTSSMEHMDDSSQHNAQKRTWTNLQGAWGKRSSGGETNNDPADSDQDYNGVNDLEKLSRYLIQGMMNQQHQMDTTQYDGSEDEYPHEKRSWNKMNAGWGKRVNTAPAQWNKFRGAWGKREPGWNNLKGLWGKRSEKWNKLSSSWGKRDSGNSNSY
ncbi:allatostatins MIP [Uranotaenia lowii]|uniref:allatostatins MIP n=1 Tax=Uranotaenia lowii TaxID=190385 RepID=UPI00247A0957|nr:allatostatins MIP [Uranotaenia lowii]